MTVARSRPPFIERERPMLLGWLEYYRATLEVKCEGLSAEQLGLRAVAPSSLSLIGLVRHMTNIERGWFRKVFEDQDLPTAYPMGDVDVALEEIDPADVAASLAAWRAECAASREVVDRHSLDELSKQLWRGSTIGLRWIVMHLIEEYARHAGHADLLRERIDGATGT